MIMMSTSQFLKDWVLVLAVGVLVSIDIFILVVYTVVELTNENFNAILESNEENTVSLHGVRTSSYQAIIVEERNFLVI